MTDTEDALRARLQEAAELPFGAAKEALLEDVQRAAEAAELPRVAFDTRLILLDAYVAGLAPSRMFVPFARCLADYDANPTAYEPWVTHRLLWAFKHTVFAMVRFPEVPLDRVYAALDEMERRYRAGGHSMHAVYTCRHVVAAHIGDRAGADEWYDRWAAAPRDELSDCVGCEPTTKVRYLASRGRDAEAVALAEPVLLGTFTCREQPHGILTELLIPYARTGADAQARAAHRRAYRVLRGQQTELAAIGDHIGFCARTGNEARGLELLDRHLGWLDGPSSPSAAMDFAAAGALLLRRVAESGHDAMPITRPAHGDRPAGEVAVASLGAELARLALAVAARFDARNGTTGQTDQVRAVLDAEPVAEHVALTVSPPPRAPEPAPPGAEDGLSAADLVERAEALVARQDAEPARRLVDLASTDDPALTARLVALRARLAEDAEPGLREAAALFAALGDEDRRQDTLGRLGGVLCRDGRVDEGLALLRASTDHFLAGDDAGKAAWGLVRLGTALLAVDPAEAVEAFDRAGPLAERGGDRLAAGALAVARWDVLLGAPERDVAAMIAVGGEAVEAFADADAPVMAAITHQRLAGLWEEQGDADRAVAAARAAVAVVPAGASALLLASVHRTHGQVLAAVGRHAEAVPELADALAYAVRTDEQGFAAECRYLLAHAYHHSGQPQDAADVADEAITAFERLGADRAADGCRHLLIDVHLALNEPHGALALYEEIVRRRRDRGDVDGLAEVLADWADLLDRLDRDALAAARYREAGDCAAETGDVYRLAYCRYQESLSLLWCGRPEDALVALAEADRAVAELPDDQPAAKLWHRAQYDTCAVRILRAEGRLDEAIGHAERAVAGFGSAEAVRRVPGARLVLGQLLLEADRAADAEPVLRAAYVEFSREGQVHRGAAGALAKALDQLGRAEEAAKLRAEAEIPGS